MLDFFNLLPLFVFRGEKKPKIGEITFPGDGVLREFNEFKKNKDINEKEFNIKTYITFIQEKVNNGEIESKYIESPFSKFDLEFLKYLFSSKIKKINYSSISQAKNLTQLFLQKFATFMLEYREGKIKISENERNERFLFAVKCVCRLEDITKEKFGGKILIEGVTAFGQDFPDEVYKYCLQHFVESANLRNKEEIGSPNFKERSAKKYNEIEKVLFNLLEVALEIPEGKIKSRDTKKAQMILNICTEKRIKKLIENAEVELKTVNEVIKEKKKDKKSEEGNLKVLIKKNASKKLNDDEQIGIGLKISNKEDVIEEYKNIIERSKSRRKTLNYLKKVCQKRLKEKSGKSFSNEKTHSASKNKAVCKNSVESKVGDGESGLKKLTSHRGGEAKKEGTKPDLKKESDLGMQGFEEPVKGFSNKKPNIILQIIILILQLLCLDWLLKSFMESKLNANIKNSGSVKKADNKSVSKEQSQVKPQPAKTTNVVQPDPHQLQNEIVAPA